MGQESRIGRHRSGNVAPDPDREIAGLDDGTIQPQEVIDQGRHIRGFPVGDRRAGIVANVGDDGIGPGNGRAHLQTCASRVEDMVEPLREQVRAQLGAAGLGGRPLHLLAMSLGAMVAIAWAQRHPGELAGMVLINTSVRPLNPFWQRLRPRAWPVLLRSQLGLMSLPEREAAILALTSRIAADSPGVKALLDDWVGWQQAWPVRHSNVLRQLLAAARFHAPEQAPPVPLLLLAGAGDRLVDPACSRRLARTWQVPLLEPAQAGHAASGHLCNRAYLHGHS